MTLQIKHNLVIINRSLVPLSQLTESVCPGSTFWSCSDVLKRQSSFLSQGFPYRVSPAGNAFPQIPSIHLELLVTFLHTTFYESLLPVDGTWFVQHPPHGRHCGHRDGADTQFVPASRDKPPPSMCGRAVTPTLSHGVEDSCGSTPLLCPYLC